MNKVETQEAEKAEIKTTIQRMIDKNYEVVVKEFGEDNIHSLFYFSQTLTNKIALGEIQTVSAANVLLSKMKAIIVKFHDNNESMLRN